MSWVDNLITDFVISTGDDKVYTPLSLYMTWNRNLQFNISEFVFKDVKGSLIIRGMPRGMQYNIEIVFQGPDNLNEAAEFLESSKDSRPWTITHPFYGKLFVQPVSLTQDNGKLNQSIISGLVIETILEDGLAVTNNAPDAIAAAAAVVNSNFSETYAAAVRSMDVSSLQILQNHITGIYATVSTKIAAVQADVTNYNNAFSASLAILNPLLHDTIEIIEQTQSLLMAPALFTDTVANRFNMYKAQIEVLNLDVANIVAIFNRPTRDLKKLYENNAGVSVAGLCLAAVSNVTNDYDYRPTVLNLISDIISAYNGYMSNLCYLQTDNGGQVDSYIPDATAVTSLSDIVKTTTATLFAISAGAKQQRKKVLPYDSNVLIEAWELYGMEDDDSTVATLIANNNIGIDELLVLKQGRELIYYV